ncbi:MAG: hypothetical protein K6G33_00900 [Ruminococcus sp.]|uniref:hypothetical protein n=1 Tax=Ruminococcus sp. TaxID=41978 RepID=UPI0025EA1775|nr:hypothetical protein [Ruminococcus sp.]MCR5599292.1 hypothetical protein [Ruminococcus sp.]
MKLNYRDKIIAAFLIAVAILAIGFFALVKPKRKELNTNQKILTEVQETRRKIEAKISEIPKLQESIKKIHKDTNEIAEKFVPVDQVNNPVVIDKYMQKFADDCKVKLKSVELGKSKLSPINYYYGDNSDSLDELRKSADVNGTLSADYNASLAEQKALEQRAKESIIQTQYGINIEGTKANVWKYLDALKNFDKNVLVNSVQISDYTFGKNKAEEANVPFPEGESEDVIEVEVGENQVIKNTSDVSIVITLYSVFEMPEPDVDTVPAAVE